MNNLTDSIFLSHETKLVVYGVNIPILLLYSHKGVKHNTQSFGDDQSTGLSFGNVGILTNEKPYKLNKAERNQSQKKTMKLT